MTHTALAPSVSTATLPAVDPNLEAKIDRGIEILTNLPPRNPLNNLERFARRANFKALKDEFDITEVEALPLMGEVSRGRTHDARLCLMRKLEDLQNRN